MVITVFCKLSVFCQIVVRFGDWRRASSAVKAEKATTRDGVESTQRDQLVCCPINT
jgi:hypothetical protein